MFQRKPFLAIGLLLITINFAHSQVKWEQKYSGTTAQLTYVQFLNKDTGYVVGRNVILKTLNGGETWIKDEIIGPQVGLSSVYFVNQSIGYASGYNGAFIKTVNSGNSWVNLSLDFPGTFYSVFFTTIDTGYLVGYWGVILQTTNGGFTWNVLSMNEFPILYQIHFINNLVGFAVGKYGTIIRTNDGGLTWNYIYSPTMESLFHIDFIDNLNGFITGYNCTILKTTDGGFSWSELNCPLSLEFYNSIAYSTNGIAYIAASDGYIIMTNDNGISWIAENIGFDERLISICFPEQNIGYVVGDQGMIYKTEITTSTEVGSTSCFDLFPNPATDRITIICNNSQSDDIHIYNCIGSEVFKTQNDSTSTLIDISNFAPGLYIVEIGGCQYKFVKQEN